MAETKRGQADVPASRAGRRKLLLVLAPVLALVLGGGTAAAYFLGLLGTPWPKAEAASSAGVGAGVGQEDSASAETDDGEGSAGGGADGVGREAIFVDLPDMLVNLQPDGQRMRFLRLRVALEVGSGKAAAVIKTLTPRVLDSFQMYLRALTVGDVQGSVGMQRLKEEMIARVNLAIEPNRVRDVLVKEILVQ